MPNEREWGGGGRVREAKSKGVWRLQDPEGLAKGGKKNSRGVVAVGINGRGGWPGVTNH